MKHIHLFILIISLFISACGPSRHAVQVEMRYPSKSGIELAGKIVSVAYLTDGNETGDLFNASLSVGFAETLEMDYGTGEGSVGVYSIQDRGGKYSTRDSLVNILMDTGSDAVFLFDKPSVSTSDDGLFKFNIRLYCFDAMNKAENVYSFVGNKVINTVAEDLVSEAMKTGEIVAGSFKSQWKHEQYSIVYYDSDKWYDALVRAETYDWRGALHIWMTLLTTSDMYKRSCLEYNIAVACYMLGDYTLASEWLDRSDNDSKLPLSDALRKRINTRLQ